MYTTVIGIKRMIAGGDAATEWNLVMATAMLAMLPPALVVVLMQRWFVKGLVETGEIDDMAKVDLPRRPQELRRRSRSSTASTADVADGEFVVIVGPSGCGKSTLLRMVAGLEAITAGEIAIGDRVVNELEPKDRDIAMVFQNYALYPHMTVFDNMAYGLKIRGFAKAEIGPASTAPPASSSSGRCSSRKPRAALGRPAPARRDGPRHRARADGVPVRRAAVEPRRQAARADALRDPEAAPAARRPRRSTSPTTRSRR